jgi:MFS family permease
MTAVCAVLLTVALMTNTASLPVVLIISGLQGATQSFDTPARQSWVPILVPRELLGNAIGLNSTGFTAPGVIGPPLAGLLIAVSGIAPCMALNAVVKVAVVVAILFMQPSPASSSGRTSFWSAIVEGLRYIWAHPALRWIYLMVALTSLSVRSYNFVLPAYARHVVDTDARGLGLLMAAAAIGGVTGALSVAAANVRRRSLVWFVSSLVGSLSVAALGITATVPLAAVALLFVGIGAQSFSGSSNILIQTLAPDDMRGRIVSVYSMIQLGLVPGGALVIGSIARFVDLPLVLIGAGLLCAAVGCWTYFAHPKLRAI